MRTSAACFLAGACLASSLAALPKCADDVKVNWFHLQEDTMAWDGLLPAVAREWKVVSDEVRSDLPGSKFGAALFGGDDKEYELVSDLTADLQADKIEKAFGRQDGQLQEWPHNLTGVKITNSTSGPVRSISPLVWASLHSNWDKSPKTYKFVTIAQVSPPQYSGDGTKAALKATMSGEIKAFDEYVYPASAPEMWPTDIQPRLNTDRAEPTLQFVQGVLAKQNVHLIVNAGATRKGSSLEMWKQVMKQVNQNPDKSLFYLPGSLKSAEDRNLSSNIIAGMESVMGCSLKAPRRLLEAIGDQDAVAEQACDNVCECHSAECRPCCKKGDKVLIDILDEPSHLNISMGATVTN